MAKVKKPVVPLQPTEAHKTPKCRCKSRSDEITRCSPHGCHCCYWCCKYCNGTAKNEVCPLCTEILRKHKAKCTGPNCKKCPDFMKRGCKNCKPKVGITAFCLTVLFLLLIASVMYFFAWKSDPGFKQLRDYWNNGTSPTHCKSRRRLA